MSEPNREKPPISNDDELRVAIFDLRNPIGVIQGWADLLHSDPVKDEKVFTEQIPLGDVIEYMLKSINEIEQTAYRMAMYSTDQFKQRQKSELPDSQQNNIDADGLAEYPFDVALNIVLREFRISLAAANGWAWILQQQPIAASVAIENPNGSVTVGQLAQRISQQTSEGLRVLTAFTDYVNATGVLRSKPTDDPPVDAAQL